MSRRASILGLGRRGETWAGLCLDAGFDVRAFDPAPNAASAVARLPGLRREDTISAAVRSADWVICSVPDRLELIQMVLQRAQAEAPAHALVAVASPLHDIDALQSCAMRPGHVMRLVDTVGGGVALDVTDRNGLDAKQLGEALSTELAALRSLCAANVTYSDGPDAESA
ncbi:MAG: NAD(P)-binding domain-containing protein [Pseudomonadota bacterium]